MVKKFLTFGILLVVLTGLLVPHVAFGGTLADDVRKANSLAVGGESANSAGKAAAAVLDGLFAPLFKLIGFFLIGISSLFLTIAGKFFDIVVNYTIIDMAKNFSEKGLDRGITEAWATLRDIANMCFIFVLLFAAFKAMFDTQFGGYAKTIMNIIIVALLINFSLFFSKVVIDASNVVSLGFYKSIATANSASLGENKFDGISGGYMRMLGLQTFYGSGTLTGMNDAMSIITFGVLGSIFLLLTAVILLIAGIMFAARFIILIFLMILSPLALIAIIIPGMNKHFNEWRESLISQSFFAPIFFALTWVVFKIGSTLIAIIPKDSQFATLGTKPDPGAMALVLNFVLIIGFSIAALIFAKNMATKGAAGTAFKAVAGGVGAATIGAGAWAGRKSIGAASALVSEKYRDTLSKNAAGRSILWAANKGKNATFDVRNVGNAGWMKKVGADKYLNEVTGVAGKAETKGYAKLEEEKAKRKAQYAKDVYGQSESEKDKAAELKTEYEEKKKEEDARIKAEKDRIKAEIAEKEKLKNETLSLAKQKEYQDEINKLKEELNKPDKERYSEEFTKLFEEYSQASDAWKGRMEKYAERLEDKLPGKIADAVGGAISGGVTGGISGAIGGPVGSVIGGIGGAIGGAIVSSMKENRKASSRAVRKLKTGKSLEEQALDILKKQDEERKKKEESQNTTPAPAPNPNP